MGVVQATAAPMVEATSCFALCDAEFHSKAITSQCTLGPVTDNVCAGSANVGFDVHAVSCADAMPFARNTAHHALVGALLRGQENYCIAASGFTAYACGEVGIPSLYGSGGSNVEVRYYGMVAVSSGAAPAMTGGLVCGGDGCLFNLSTSVIMGNAPGSVGFIWNEFHNGPSAAFPRSDPPASYFDLDVDAAWGGRMVLRNVSFTGFSGAGSAAIVGGFDPDSSAPLQVSGLTFAAGDSRIYMRDPDPGWRTDDNCGSNTDCTGPHNTLLIDVDGSLSGAPSQVLPNNEPLLSADPRCVRRSGWNGYVCNGTSFRMLYYETLDPDFLSRRLWPVTFAQPHGQTVMAGFEDHLWNGGWTSLLRMNRYAAPVESDVTISLSGSPPRKLRLQIPHDEVPTIAGTLVRLNYVRPEIPTLLIGNVTMTRVYEAPPNTTAPHGTWYWYNLGRQLTVVLHAGHPAIVSTLTDLVMISLYISVTDAQFWSAPTEAFLNDVAYSLGLDPGTLVIAGAAPSSQRRRRLRSGG